MKIGSQSLPRAGSASRGEKIIARWLAALPESARAQPALVSGGRAYTASEMAGEMRRETPLGKSLLAFLSARMRAGKTYRCLHAGREIESAAPGLYAGWKPGKVFGLLDCKSGMRMKPENRVFFLTIQDAKAAGFRPCKHCKPESRQF